jgi:hypothetical protein
MFDTAGAAKQTNLAFLVEVKVIPDRTARDIHNGYPLKNDLRRGEEGKGGGPRLTFTVVVRTSKRTTDQVHHQPRLRSVGGLSLMDHHRGFGTSLSASHAHKYKYPYPDQETTEWNV